MVVQALTREALHLGALHTTRDLNFVGDTVRGFMLAAERDEALGQVVNLANGKEISVGELAKKVLRAVGRELPIVTESQRMRPGASEVERLCGDASRARALLGWAPEVSLDEGVARVVDYVRANLGRYQPEVYAV